jgi:hypothetical protein
VECGVVLLLPPENGPVRIEAIAANPRVRRMATFAEIRGMLSLASARLDGEVQAHEMMSLQARIIAKQQEQVVPVKGNGRGMLDFVRGKLRR